MLKILSCPSWPCHIFHEQFLFEFVAIFYWIICLLIIWLWICLYFQNTNLLSYIYSKYSLPFCILPFHFLSSIFLILKSQIYHFFLLYFIIYVPFKQSLPIVLVHFKWLLCNDIYNLFYGYQLFSFLFNFGQLCLAR